MALSLMDHWMAEDAVLRARKATYGPEVRAVAVWLGESGSTYTWPQAMADNRRSRVMARIRQFGMERPVGPDALVILTVEGGVAR